MRDLFEIRQNEEEILFAQKFTTRSASEELIQKIENLSNSLENHDKASRIPFWLSIVMYVCGVIALIVFGSVVEVLTNGTTFKEMLDNALGLFIAGIVGLVVALGIFIYSRIKFNKVVNAQELKDDVDQAEVLVKESLDYFGFDIENTYNLDIFLSAVKEKNGKIKKASSICNVMLCNFNFTVQDNKLVFTDLRNTFEIPMDCIKSFKETKETISFFGWNKDDQPVKGKYRGCKIVNQNNIMTMKTYCILTLEYDFETYIIKIPRYEAKEFERITNIKLEQLSENDD